MVPFQNQWFGVAMGIVMPVCIAAVLGIIMFRKRIAGVFVSVITLALVLLVRLVIIDAQPVHQRVQRPDRSRLVQAVRLRVRSVSRRRPIIWSPARSRSYWSCGAGLLIETRAGLILQAIRDDQNRARYLGFDVARFQAFFFTVSAAISGVRRHALCHRRRVRLADVHGLELLHHHGRVGRPRRPRLDPWRLHRRHHHQHADCDGQRDQRFVEAWKAIIGLIFVLVVLYLPRGLAGFGQDLVDRFVNRFSASRLKTAAGQQAKEIQAGGIGHAHDRSLDHRRLSGSTLPASKPSTRYR